MPETIVIAGAGHAAGQAVASLKQSRFAGKIVLIGDEGWLPYQRPPLSKKFLAGELPAERLLVKPALFYDDPQIDVRLDTRVTGIDRDAKTVTAGGEIVDYDSLILALGSRVRSLSVPGSELAGVHYLRSIADVEHIRSDFGPDRRVVIVGAGYIGLEVAAVSRQLGLSVTVVELADRVMSRVVSPAVSAFYQQLHADRGVDLRLATGLDSFEGDARVAAVVTDDGRTIDADLVVVGIGILPNTELAEAAGLTIDNGIVVNEYCRTDDPAVFAAGDCTTHPNAIYDRRVRLESVHNALEQARTAAANACGDNARYSDVPWFWSDQFDVKLQIAGLSEGYEETVLRGDPASGRFACFYLRRDVLIAVDAVNSPREFLQAKPLIATRTKVDKAALADPARMLKELA